MTYYVEKRTAYGRTIWAVVRVDGNHTVARCDTPLDAQLVLFALENAPS